MIWHKYIFPSLLVIVPLTYAPFLTRDPTRIKELLVGFAMLAWLVYRLMARRGVEEEPPRRFGAVEAALGLYLFTNVLSLALSPSEFAGGTYPYELLMLAAVFFAFSGVARSSSAAAFVRWIAAGAAPVLIYAVVQGALGSPYKPISTIGNPNYLGAYILAVLPALVILFTDPRVLIRFMAACLCTLVVAVLLLIKSWAAFLTIGLSPIILIPALVPAGRRRLQFLALYGAVLIGMFSIAGVRESLALQIVQDVRGYIWKGTFEMFLAHPWSGCGAGQFFLSYPTFRDTAYFTHPLSVDSTDHAHSELLELLAETGLCGTVSFLFFVLAVVCEVLKRAHGRDPAERRRLFCILAGAGLLAMENMFDVNFRYMSSQFLFWSFLGFCHGSAGCASPAKRSSRGVVAARPLFVILGLGVLLFLFFQGVMAPFISDVYYRHGIRERRSERYDEAVRFYRKALAVWPKHIEARYRLAYLYGSMGMNRLAIETYKEVTRYAPFFASVHGNMGIIYARMENWSQARAHFLIQTRMNPYDAEKLVLFARVLIQAGQIEQAKGLLVKARVLKPEHALVRETLESLAGVRIATEA